MGCTGRKGSSWLLSFLDYEAMGWPPGQTLGKLCPAGHQWNQLKASLRSQGKCVCCESIRRTSPAALATRQAWYQANREKLCREAKQRAAIRRANPVLAEADRQRQLTPARAEQRRIYKAKVRQSFKEQGLTTRGTERINDIPATALQKAIRAAGRSPSVARLVMDEQLRHWREHPSDRATHDRQWAQASWWLKYQITPELRLYHREKSKRRKAQDRGQTPVQIPVSALRQRFNEFGNCCAYCGDGGDMQIEHVEPISKGGAHDIGNIVPACFRCNTSKRNHEMEEWYRSQPFFSELRLHRIRRTMHQPEAHQLAML
jgi:5-methylcytosine-specific restriction endonuclease McrA